MMQCLRTTSETTRHMARMSVAAELLIQALHLPANTEIRAAHFDGRDVEFVVEHPDLESVSGGDALPSVKAWFRTTRVPAVAAEVVEFDGWH